MELCFLGAAREVTGSRYLLNAAGKRILIDCGMEQGADIYENQELPVPASGVDCVVLTHAHIDHSGMLPALYKDGFRGPIYATPATMALCEIMLRDSAHIQMQEAQWRNRKAERAGRPLYEPIYDMDDAGARSWASRCRNRTCRLMRTAARRRPRRHRCRCRGGPSICR